MGDLFGLVILICRSDERMKRGIDHGQLGDVKVDPENIMKRSVIIMYIGSAAFQDLAIAGLHQIAGMVRRLTSLMVPVADHIKNCIRRPVSNASSCNVSVYDINNGVFRILGFQVVNHNFTVRPEF